MPRTRHSLVSLFCGAGGLDKGFRGAGFDIALACDNFRAAIDSYNLNTRKKVGRVADLSVIRPKTFIRLLREVSPDASPLGVIGGPPCQGFSRGNAYGNVDDVRNQLPFAYVRLLKALNDAFTIRFFVFENVLGLLNERHIERFNRLNNSFSKAGFTVFQGELNANQFRVAQNRRRLFIVGLNTKIYGHLRFLFPKGSDDRKSIRDVIADLPEPVFNTKTLEVGAIPYHRNHRTSMPVSGKLITGGSKDGRSFRRLCWDCESPTIAYGNREIHVHPDGGRRLSIHEALLLQGFSKTFRLAGTFSEQVTQVSNAVPPPVARAIAQRLYSLVNTKSQKTKPCQT